MSWTSKKEQNLKMSGEHTGHVPCWWTRPDLSLDSAESPGQIPGWRPRGRARLVWLKGSKNMGSLNLPTHGGNT